MLRRVDHSSLGDLPSVACAMSAIAKNSTGGHDPESGRSATGKRNALTWALLKRQKMERGARGADGKKENTGPQNETDA